MTFSAVVEPETTTDFPACYARATELQFPATDIPVDADRQGSG